MPRKTCTHRDAGVPALTFSMLNVAPWGDCSDIVADAPVGAHCYLCSRDVPRPIWEKAIRWNQRKDSLSEDLPTQVPNLATFVAEHILPDMTDVERQQLAEMLKA